MFARGLPMQIPLALAFFIPALTPLADQLPLKFGHRADDVGCSPTERPNQSQAAQRLLRSVAKTLGSAPA